MEEEKILCTLTELVERVENLPDFLTRLDNVVVSDQLPAISILTSPIVHLTWPIAELFFKYRTDFFQATVLPPVDEEFCERALFVYTTEFRLLCRYLFEELLASNVNVTLQPRFIKVCRHSSRRIQVDSDCLLIAVHNNCAEIKLANKYQIYIDDLSAHALILVHGNRLVGSEIEFVGAESTSLFLMFDFALDGEPPTKSRQDNDQNNVSIWTRCARYIDEYETCQSSGELIALASVSRKLRHTQKLKTRIFDLRRFDEDGNAEPTTTLDETDCDYASTLNEELLPSTGRKRKRGEDDSEDDSKEDDNEKTGAASACDTIEAIVNADEDDDDDSEEDESVRETDGHPNILSKHVALVHPSISYSSDMFFYHSQAAYLHNEIFNTEFFDTNMRRPALVVAANSCANDFLKTKSTESIGILLDIATKNVYSVPQSLDLLFYKRNQTTTLSRKNIQAPEILLYLPSILNSDVYSIVKAPNLIFLNAFWIE